MEQQYSNNPNPSVANYNSCKNGYSGSVRIVKPNTELLTNQKVTLDKTTRNKLSKAVEKASQYHQAMVEQQAIEHAIRFHNQGRLKNCDIEAIFEKFNVEHSFDTQAFSTELNRMVEENLLEKQAYYTDSLTSLIEPVLQKFESTGLLGRDAILDKRYIDVYYTSEKRCAVLEPTYSPIAIRMDINPSNSESDKVFRALALLLWFYAGLPTALASLGCMICFELAEYLEGLSFAQLTRLKRHLEWFNHSVQESDSSEATYFFEGLPQATSYEFSEFVLELCNWNWDEEIPEGSELNYFLQETLCLPCDILLWRFGVYEDIRTRTGIDLAEASESTRHLIPQVTIELANTLPTPICTKVTLLLTSFFELIDDSVFSTDIEELGDSPSFRSNFLLCCENRGYEDKIVAQLERNLMEAGEQCLYQFSPDHESEMLCLRNVLLSCLTAEHLSTINTACRGDSNV